MINGLYYFPNVVPVSLADDVLDCTNSYNEWDTMSNGRSMLQFGYKHDYTKNYGTNEFDDTLPDVLRRLRNIIEEKLGFNHKLDNCFVNKYCDNQEIGLHIDPPCFGHVIGCFSFYEEPEHGNNTYITFKNKNNDIYKQNVPHCSLYIMTGESRYKWKHGLLSSSSNISNVSNYKRISVGFSGRPMNGNKYKSK